MQFIDNFPLKNITTLEIGGPAKKFVEVTTEEELIKAIDYAGENRLAYLVIGGGSNLLVSDKGIDCLVIKNSIRGISQDGLIVTAKAGTLLQELVDFCLTHGLAGLQNLAGIPGTVGGAIYGNAGAYGQTISDHLVKVTAYDGQKFLTLTKNECRFSYRDSVFKKTKFPISEITLELKNGHTRELAEEAAGIIQKRLVKYPKGIKCPGSFFKNIVAETLPTEIISKIPAEKIVYGKLPAGSLLEEVGAKGDKLGDIEIAPYHANLFINRGGGKAEDFYNLAKKYVEKVKEKYGITLEPEVQLINLPSLI